MSKSGANSLPRWTRRNGSDAIAARCWVGRERERACKLGASSAVVIARPVPRLQLIATRQTRHYGVHVAESHGGLHQNLQMVLLRVSRLLQGRSRTLEHDEGGSTTTQESTRVTQVGPHSLSVPSLITLPSARSSAFSRALAPRHSFLSFSRRSRGAPLRVHRDFLAQ